ncbi:hypothetical protein C8Q76DRAFT_797223 [Earliella scabrosa]|nr:hypothetical protein C8Q76DRAFT_797223 [Earliella scabrosa]
MSGFIPTPTASPPCDIATQQLHSGAIAAGALDVRSHSPHSDSSGTSCSTSPLLTPLKIPLRLQPPLGDTGVSSSLSQLEQHKRDELAVGYPPSHHALLERTPSPTPSDTTSPTGDGSLKDVVGAINACAALSGSVSSLIRETNEAIVRDPWQTFDENTSERVEIMASVLREVKDLYRLNGRVLEAVDKSVRLQGALSERMFEFQEEVSNLRCNVDSSGRATKRALYRTRGLHQECVDVQDAVTATRDKLDDEVRELSASLALLQRDHTQLRAEYDTLKSDLANTRAAASSRSGELSSALMLLQAELVAVQTSSWSYKIRVMAQQARALPGASVLALARIARNCYRGCQDAMRDYIEVLADNPHLTTALLMSVVLEETQRQTAPVIARPIWESARMARLM